MTTKKSDKKKPVGKKPGKSSRIPDTEGPIAEKDEVKAAEERTKEGMKRAKSYPI